METLECIILYILRNFIVADLFDLGMPDLLASLPPELSIALKEAAVSLQYADGQLVHAREDGIQALSIIRSGAVRIGYVDAEGAYSGVAILGPGQFFGEFTLFASLPRRFDAIAAGPAVVDEINQTRFDRLLEKHRGIRTHFLASLAHRLHAALETIDDMRRLPLTVRVAKTLNLMQMSETSEKTLKVTQTDLADLLGVTRVSVNKALGELERQNLIVRSYGRIEITSELTLSQWVKHHSSPVPLLI
jgi:CRP/FNR family transcriptional regulator, cyclic AMP receptor protein